MKKTQLFFCAAALFLSIASKAQDSKQWVLRQTEWSSEDEARYSEYISRFAKLVETKKCSTLSSCLRQPELQLGAFAPKDYNFEADCSRLPYILRTLFAWKYSLPFSYSEQMRAREITGGGVNSNKDIRYSRWGNAVLQRFDIVSKDPLGVLDGLSMMVRAVDTISSAHYRTSLDDPPSNELFSDFYSVEISRASIAPGTIIYDPNGHVASVGRVTDDGRIFYFDSHPDNTITWGLYGSKFVRSNPGQGSGFKKFRPLRLVGATALADGRWVGGQIKGLRNEYIKDYSRQQFFGTKLPEPADWKQSIFEIAGRQYNFYDFVRRKLALRDIDDPLEDVRFLTRDICMAAQDRSQAVDLATKANIYLQPSPERLPVNIYGTSGDWETYSTPSRDARLRASFRELRGLVQTIVEKSARRRSANHPTDQELKSQLLKAYLETASDCKVSYINSMKTTISIDLEEIRQRLFRLSFDPYHCPELRWGASNESELASCPRDEIKFAWFLKERWLRYQIDRTGEGRMDYSLDEITGPMPGGVGVSQPPDVDVIGYLKN